MNPLQSKLDEINLHDPRLLNALKFVGIGEAVAVRVWEKFKEKTTEKIFIEDAYNLMDVEGIGFTRADNVARLLGYKEEDPRRLRALVYSTVENNRSFGHTYLPTTILEKELKKQKIYQYQEMLDDLLNEGKFVLDDNRIYTRRLYLAETQTAEHLISRLLLNATNAPTYEAHTKISGADPDQETAISASISNRLMVVTGGPGVGKTFTINNICNLLESHKLKVALCAPTGKAAKRVQDLSGREAKTIHRLLKAGYGDWGYNAQNKYKSADCIIVDESSMLDVELAWRLLQALPLTTQIVFVGDKDQLPPVGPGTFFKDLIASTKIPTFYLRTNHRQGGGSLIAENARRINAGDLKLTFDDDIDSGMQLILADSPIDVRQCIMPLMRSLAKKYDVYSEVQVLTPQHKTLCGVESINELLRFELNPGAKAREKFSVGDKVMQTVNNYDLDIYNGYAGKIINETSKHYIIDFFDDKRVVEYPKSSSSELMLAYACTVHKSQGSEYKCAVVIVSSSHVWMLTRNLLYTAVTRAKEKCVIVGDLMGLKGAIKNARENERYSKLQSRVLGTL